MRLFIQDYVIDESQLWDWSHDEGAQHQDQWIRSIATQLIAWLNEEPFMTVSTSGSTGTPKIIRHSKSAMRKSAHLTAKRFGLLQGMTSLNCLPAQFIAGKMMLIRALVLQLDQFCIEPKLILAPKFQKSFDFVAMTPMQLSATLKNNTELIQRINTLILGGGPIMKKLDDKIQGLKTLCYATYGMTETITHIATRPINGSDKTEIFEALDDVHFTTQNGNLVIHAEHIDSSPLSTTDQVALFDNRHFQWKGRSDYVINSGGVKIHPEQLEEQLQGIIMDRYIVTSRPNDESGEEVVLLIESVPYTKRKLQVLKDFVRGIPKIKQPKDILFVKTFLETPTGKIRRNYNLYPSMST